MATGNQTTLIPELFMSDLNATANHTGCQNIGTGYFVASWYLALSVPGILLYSFTLYILISKYSKLGSTFYLLAIALACPDILTLCLTAFYGVPCILWCGHIWPFITPFAFGWMTHFCWYLQITLIFIISLNRFICMRSKAFKEYDHLFTTKRMILYVTLVYVFSLALIMMMLFMSCISVYNFDSYYFGMKCSDEHNGPIAQVINVIICDVIIGVTALIYMFSWIVMKLRARAAAASVSTVDASGTATTTNAASQLQHASRKKAESRLFWQFIIVSSVLVMYELSFYILPYVTSGTAFTVITGTIYIAVCSMNGYLHILFNSVIQTEVKQYVNKVRS